MKFFNFLTYRDTTEVLIIFLGGLVVVVFAFFMARGDLGAYVDLLLKGNLPVEEKIVFSPEREERSSFEEEILSEVVVPSTSLVEGFNGEKVEISPKSETVASPTPQVTSSLAVSPSPTIIRPKAVSGSFFVQVGAFSKESNAQGMVVTLKGLGYSATVERVSSLYRVRIYGFSSLEEAQKVVSRLKTQGIECFAGK
ncbi:MAG: SPOR domain-containing protein [Candidatus Caldatribacteriaceae bacterium]